jgi:methionine biosynthesis protein MetW
MRPDLAVVAGLVPPGSRVLDLGCGDGTLLEHLIRAKGCDGHGIERAEEGIHACIARGVPVIEADLDEGLPDFEAGAFDVVVLSQTLQATRRPALVVQEMLRVGRRAVASFPNFGHWRLRTSLLLRGRMPESVALPYAWFETPNIHLCTARDFEALASELGAGVVERVPLDPHGARAHRVVRVRPNLLAAGAVYVLESD